eukprot:COSAG01_NODE_17254_length_1166_cov_1.529522_1_plen_68_part_00
MIGPGDLARQNTTALIESDDAEASSDNVDDLSGSIVPQRSCVFGFGGLVELIGIDLKIWQRSIDDGV